MQTKRKFRDELKNLIGLIQENNKLLRQAAMRAGHIRGQYDALKTDLERVKRGQRSGRRELQYDRTQKISKALTG
jgi:hypothetical protein